jgi:hypothetical protein
LAIVEKQLQQARNENQALARYINTKRKKEDVRKKEEAWKKMEEEAHKKVMEGQSSMDDVRTSTKGDPSSC